MGWDDVSGFELDWRARFRVEVTLIREQGQEVRFGV